MALLALAAGPVALAQPAAAPSLTVSARLTSAENQTYRALPFEVPAGVSRITLAIDYDHANHTTFDIGLADPLRFRGWSGGNKVEGVADGRLKVIEDGKPAAGPADASVGPGLPDRTFQVTADSARHWLRLNVRDARGRLLLIGNPIYLTPPQASPRPSGEPVNLGAAAPGSRYSARDWGAHQGID